MVLYLYKVLTVQDWKASKSFKYIKLSDSDKEFIHLSKKDQLSRIIEKYWADVSEYVILELDASQLKGDLIFETNPGGANKYYHLYNGSIPHEAIVKVEMINRSIEP